MWSISLRHWGCLDCCAEIGLEDVSDTDDRNQNPVSMVSREGAGRDSHNSRDLLEGADHLGVRKTNFFEGVGPDLNKPRVSLEGADGWGLERTGIWGGG
jgi:hypothetical protein